MQQLLTPPAAGASRPWLSRPAFHAPSLAVSRAVPLAVAAVSAIYLLQSLTPLRLDNDSVVYLHMATSLADGLGLEPTGLPLGYPAFIAMLDRLGLGFSFVFVLANCAFVALGLISLRFIFRRQNTDRLWVITLLALLSWPLIRFITMPLPECMFFGFSLASIAVMTSATESDFSARRAMRLILALVLVTIAITVRMVGFALVPALLWSCLPVSRRTRDPKASVTAKEKWIVVAAVVLLMLTSLMLLDDSFSKYAAESRLGHFTGRFTNLCTTLGQIFLNLPSSRLQWLRSGLPLSAIGLCLVVCLRIRRPRGPASIYLVTFLTVLLLWPYDAVRLWVPIIPLMIGYASQAGLRFSPARLLRGALNVYVAWFMVTGVAALAYTTRITFSGANFSKVYGKAGGMSSPDRRTGKVDDIHNARARELMKRYGNPF